MPPNTTTWRLVRLAPRPIKYKCSYLIISCTICTVYSSCSYLQVGLRCSIRVDIRVNGDGPVRHVLKSGKWVTTTTNARKRDAKPQPFLWAFAFMICSRFRLFCPSSLQVTPRPRCCTRFRWRETFDNCWASTSRRKTSSRCTGSGRWTLSCCWCPTNLWRCFSTLIRTGLRWQRYTDEKLRLYNTVDRMK